MTKIRLALWAILSLWLAGSVFAQQKLAVIPAETIYGWEHPGEITDAVAIRLSMTAKETDGHFAARVGLPTAEDTETLKSTRNHFLSAYTEIIDKFNAYVKKVHNVNVDETAKDAAVNKLAVETMRSLETDLSPAARVQFNRFLTEDRRWMAVSAFDAGLGKIAQDRLKDRLAEHYAMLQEQSPTPYIICNGCPPNPPPPPHLIPKYSGYSTMGTYTGQDGNQADTDFEITQNLSGNSTVQGVGTYTHVTGTLVMQKPTLNNNVAQVVHPSTVFGLGGGISANYLAWAPGSLDDTGDWNVGIQVECDYCTDQVLFTLPLYAAAGGFGLRIRAAITAVVDLGEAGIPNPLPNAPNAIKYNVTNSCSEPTQPPDMPINAVTVSNGFRYSYYLGLGACLYAPDGQSVFFCTNQAQTVFQKWLYIPLAEAAPVPQLVASGYDCTKRSAGYSGFPKIPWPF